MTERKPDTSKASPLPSQAEGDRETIEQDLNDRNNAEQTRRQQRGRDDRDSAQQPSQAEGERDKTQHTNR